MVLDNVSLCGVCLDKLLPASASCSFTLPCASIAVVNCVSRLDLDGLFQVCIVMSWSLPSCSVPLTSCGLVQYAISSTRRPFMGNRTVGPLLESTVRALISALDPHSWPPATAEEPAFFGLQETYSLAKRPPTSQATIFSKEIFSSHTHAKCNLTTRIRKKSMPYARAASRTTKHMWFEFRLPMGM